jgi:hypothetical protein
MVEDRDKTPIKEIFETKDKIFINPLSKNENKFSLSAISEII